MEESPIFFATVYDEKGNFIAGVCRYFSEIFISHDSREFYRNQSKISELVYSEKNCPPVSSEASERFTPCGKTFIELISTLSNAMKAHEKKSKQK